MTEETPIYRPAVRAGDLVFVSGQIGLGPDGMAETLEGQIAQVLVNLDKVLTDQGVERSQVVKATVFLTDMDDFPALNEQYREFFADPRPARSTIAVANLPFGARVEIEVVAYTGGVVRPAVKAGLWGAGAADSVRAWRSHHPRHTVRRAPGGFHHHRRCALGRPWPLAPQGGRVPPRGLRAHRDERLTTPS